MYKRDFILVHAPSVYDFRKRTVLTGPVSDMVPSTPIFEMYPLGFTTMCEYFERHGLRCKMYNLASYMLHKKGFDVEANLAALDTRCFGIDLHWMPHCHGSVEVAKILKRLHPGVPVVFGGISSSFFHEELIRLDCIDYVVRGDSTEAPMLELLRRIRQADLTHTPVGDLSDIPNLTWKDATGGIHVNPLSWVPDTMDAISLDYAFPMKGVVRERDFTSYLPTRDWLSYPVCASLTSRGCKRNCVTCGGSAYAYKNHLGRRRVAWRDPDLLIRDIETIQEHIPGPVFVLNDFLMAGTRYTHHFIEGLRGKLEQPIGFEFFGPPREGKDLYRLLSDNLPHWSVEISAESYDDEVRTAFGKGHYTMAELEDTIVDALDAGAQRFDLYFMTGIPKQTKESILGTGEYVRHLYERVHNDPRLLVFISPMAPFLDVGSRAFDDPERFGYRLRARTLQEHRDLMLAPSWKQTMNYESVYLSADDMVDATYQAGIDIALAKADAGVISREEAEATRRNIERGRSQMHRLDDLIDQAGGDWDAARERFNEEVRREQASVANEDTVAKKSDLNWPFRPKPVNVTSNVKLLLQMVGGQIKAGLHGELVGAGSDYDYPEQVNGTLSPLKYPLVGGTITPEPGHEAASACSAGSAAAAHLGRVTPASARVLAQAGCDVREPASEGDLFDRGLMDLDDVVPAADEAPLVSDLPAPLPGSPMDTEEHGLRPGVGAGKAR